jgi:hypothetical protein
MFVVLALREITFANAFDVCHLKSVSDDQALLPNPSGKISFPG